MADKTNAPPGDRNIEPGTAWLSGIIVTTLSGGVAILSASLLSTILVACGIAVAVALALGVLAH